MKASEYKPYLERLTHLVYIELVPKAAIFDYFTDHSSEHGVNLAEVEPLVWFIESGLHYDLTFSIMRLFDRNSERNIYHFIDFAEKHVGEIAWRTPLDAAAFREQRAHLEQVEPIVQRLRKRRNKFFAHYGKKYFYDPGSVSRDYPLTNEDAKTLVRALQHVLINHSHAFKSGGTMSMEGVFYMAASRLYKQMVDAWAASEKKFKNQDIAP